MGILFDYIFSKIVMKFTCKGNHKYEIDWYPIYNHGFKKTRKCKSCGYIELWNK